MHIILETQKAVTKDDPQKLLSYAVTQIHLDESNKKIKFYLRSDESIQKILEAVNHIYKLAAEHRPKPVTVPVKTTLYTENKCFVFENEIILALNLFRKIKAISNVTHKEVIACMEKNRKIIDGQSNTVRLA